MYDLVKLYVDYCMFSLKSIYEWVIIHDFSNLYYIIQNKLYISGVHMVDVDLFAEGLFDISIKRLPQGTPLGLLDTN